MLRLFISSLIYLSCIVAPAQDSTSRKTIKYGGTSEVFVFHTDLSPVSTENLYYHPSVLVEINRFHLAAGFCFGYHYYGDVKSYWPSVKFGYNFFRFKHQAEINGYLNLMPLFVRGTHSISAWDGHHYNYGKATIHSSSYLFEPGISYRQFFLKHFFASASIGLMTGFTRDKSAYDYYIIPDNNQDAETYWWGEQMTLRLGLGFLLTK